MIGWEHKSNSRASKNQPHPLVGWFSSFFLNMAEKTPSCHRVTLRPPTLLKFPSRRLEAWFSKNFSTYRNFGSRLYRFHEILQIKVKKTFSGVCVTVKFYVCKYFNFLLKQFNFLNMSFQLQLCISEKWNLWESEKFSRFFSENWQKVALL